MYWLGFEVGKLREGEECIKKKRACLFVCVFGVYMVCLALPSHEVFTYRACFRVWNMTQTGLLHGK